jgi:hypothetical protein
MTSILSYIGIIACAIALGISISAVALHRKHKTIERRWLPPKVLAVFFWVILGWLLEKVTHNGYTLTEAKVLVSYAYVLIFATTAISLTYVKLKKEAHVKAFIAHLEGTCLCCQGA